MDGQLKMIAKPLCWRRGFSFVELLVVMAVIGILVLGISSVSVSGSMKVSTTGQLVRDNLNLARTTAISRNRSVQVVFYKVPSAASSSVQYRGMQLFALNASEGNPVPLTKYIPFPTSFIVDSSQVTYGTLLYGSSATVSGTGTVASLGSGFAYKGFTYKSDGSTDLAVKGPGGDTWFLLVRSELDTATPPKNYYIVQVDPVNGRTQTFRP